MTCFSTSDDSWAHTTTDPDRFNGLKPLPVGRLFNCTLSVQLSFFWKSNSPKTILTIFWHGYLWVVPHSRQGSQVQKVVLRNAHQGPTNRMWYQVSKKIDPWILIGRTLRKFTLKCYGHVICDFPVAIFSLLFIKRKIEIII